MAQGNDATETILTMVLRSKTSRSAVVVGILVSMVLLSTAVPLGALAQENGEDEPNDDRLAATPIQGTQIKGNVEKQGGEDWFSVQASAGEKVSFVLTKEPTTWGVNISIHSPNGTELTNDSAFSGVLRADAETTATETGTYYLKVDAVLDDRKKIPYTLYTPAGEAPPPKDRRIPNGTDEDEPNDETVVGHANGTKIEGEVASEDDVDRLAFYVTKGEVVSILVTTPEDTSITIYYFPPSADKFHDKSGSFNIMGEEERGQESFVSPRSGLVQVNLVQHGNGELPAEPYTISVHTKPSSKSTTQTDSGDSGTVDGTASESQTTAENNQTSDGNEDNKQSNGNDETKEDSKSVSDSEMSPIMMVGIGVVIGGILIGLVVGAVFLIRQQ